MAGRQAMEKEFFFFFFVRNKKKKKKKKGNRIRNKQGKHVDGRGVALKKQKGCSFPHAFHVIIHIFIYLNF